jgi:hypothetical protein
MLLVTQELAKHFGSAIATLKSAELTTEKTDEDESTEGADSSEETESADKAGTEKADEKPEADSSTEENAEETEKSVWGGAILGNVRNLPSKKED